MSTSDQQPQLNGTTTSISSSSEYFKAIGQQVDQVAPTTNGAEQTDNDDVKPVDEIESLCMNCHENVCRFCPQIATLVLHTRD